MIDCGVSVRPSPNISSAAFWTGFFAIDSNNVPAFGKYFESTEPITLLPPGKLVPNESKAPDAAAVARPQEMSSKFALERPFFCARSSAVGPAICKAPNKNGPANAPTAPPVIAPGAAPAPAAGAPNAPPIAAPAAPPATRDNTEPANCPACSTTALGSEPIPNPPTVVSPGCGWMNLSLADS